MPNKAYSNENLHEISKYLNLFPYLVLLSIAAHFFPPALIVTGALFFYFGYQLAKADRLVKPWLWGLCALIPLAGFLCALILVFKTVAILKDNGVKVGILGVDKAEMDSLTSDADE